MAKINWGSVKAKAESFVKSDEFKERIKREGLRSSSTTHKHRVDMAEEAAKKFIDTMVSEAASRLTGPQLSAVFTEMSAGQAEDGGDGKITIPVNFSLTLKRPSLYPAGYPEGVYNIVGLLDKGYSAKSRVFSVDPVTRERMVSLQSRPGMEYVESGVANFIRAHGKRYKIERVDISEEYL